MDSWSEFEQHLVEIDSRKLVMDRMKRSIYKVPASIKDLNPKAYIPQFVTFGPYHCNYERDTEMDIHKLQALKHFIKNSKQPLSVYVNAMQEIQHELMACYDSLDVNFHSSADKFLQHMLLDGCFMLEILRANEAINSPENIYGDYSATDPIFSCHGKLYMMPDIRRDMLMLENQIPMFLLKTLLMVEATIVINQDPEIYLNRLILRFIEPNFPHWRFVAVDSRHVLDLYRKSLIGLQQPMPHIMPKYRYYESTPTIIHSAKKLHDHGIEFQPSEAESLAGISFEQGILKLPSIIVNDNSEVVFLNLIAFERVHVGAGNEVTSYVSFMRTIIRSAKDVNLLIKSNIISNDLGSEMSIADLFHGISREVKSDPESDLWKTYDKVQVYSKKKWNAWRVNVKDNLVNNYFKNPWTMLTFLAASFLILLTVAQTIYTILSYYKPEKDCYCKV